MSAAARRLRTAELVESLVRESIWDEAKHLRGFGGRFARMPDAGGGQGGGGEPGGLPPLLKFADAPDVLEDIVSFKRTDADGHEWQTDLDYTSLDPMYPGAEDEEAMNLTTRMAILKDGEEVGFAERSLYIDPPGTTLLLAEQEIEEEHQGSGFGSAYLASIAQRARAAGVARLGVTAAGEGGGYAWANTGAFQLLGNPARSQRDLMLDTVDSAIGNLEAIRHGASSRRRGPTAAELARAAAGGAPAWPAGLPEAHERLREAVNDGTLRSMREIANFERDRTYTFTEPYPPGVSDRNKTMHAAQILLRNVSWSGIWELRPTP